MQPLRILCTALLAATTLLPAAGQGRYANDRYEAEVFADGRIDLRHKASLRSVAFRPDFRILRYEKAPRCTMRRIEKQGTIDNLNYRTCAWGAETDLFRLGTPERQELERVDLLPGRAIFRFRATETGQLTASLELPAGDTEPRIGYRYHVRRRGSYSVGYCGAPAIRPADAEEVWQPLVWTQKRFPGKSYLTPDHLCSMPLAAVTAGGLSYGVVADPADFPFEPLPTFRTMRFGVALRDAAGEARPMIWAPVPGAKESLFEAGDTCTFRLRLFAAPCSMTALHEDLALHLYGLARYRRTNATGSLNATLDNMIDYGMSHYSWFVEELKGCSYETDVKRAVKNTSALNPLNIALVTDNEAIYERRFLPMYEFMLSRESLLFALEPRTGADRQVPSSTLGRPVMPPSEAAAIYEVTGAQSPFLIREMQREKGLGSNPAHERYWRGQLALYRATGQRKCLAEAQRGADRYLLEAVDAVQDRFDYKHQNASSFWTQLSPKFPDLYDLYEATGEKRYLEAARYGARRYAQFIWMCPAIPEGEVTVNAGGVAPKQKPWGEPMRVEEERVAAWRLSEIGLHAECGSTAYSHRAVFPAHHAAPMRRIADKTDDRFLERIANWAAVGRYANFPGYHINTARTTAYEKPDFPLRTHASMNVNSMHYNHVWPHISIVLDWLVTDVEVRTGGAVRFPAIAVEAFANLGCRIYGHRPGTFYGQKATLWMPRRLAACSDPQLNYLAARSGRERLYLAFANQSPEKVVATVRLDDRRVRIPSGTRARLWRDNRPAGTVTVRDGEFEIEVSGDGVTALAVEGAELRVEFQEQLLGRTEAWAHDYAKGPCGRAMLLNAGALQKRVFAYVASSAGQYRRAALRYRIDGGEWSDRLDSSFPFEFSVPLPDGASRFEYRFFLVDADSRQIEGPVHTLSREPLSPKP
ncbi:hypothetical protein [Alistipes sp.]|uniref:hypothetical protein n=1 Tax=Alistipes sp. TaxID=1872444 RepID=UPI003AF0C6A9